ncbi:hypothetical protein [Burkholderia phage FLC9]|nr:hypothetical protein [Burkholderia phage FLC9]
MEELVKALQGHSSPEAAMSKLQVYTYGTAAENLALNSFELEITPLEHTPMVDGETTTNAQTDTAQGTDLSGAQYQTQMTSSGTIRATWLPLGQPNRMTPPNVRRGEEVVVYRFGDVDKFYWNTARNDLKFRRLETVVWAISGEVIEDKACDMTNTYFIEFSSHKKTITLSTSTGKANGEKVSYQVLIDPGNGIFSVKDDLDNSLLLDSTQNQWRIQNGDGSFLDLTKKAMTGYAADSIDWKTKAWSIEATESISEQTTSRTMKATTETVTATTTHNGDTIHEGNIGLNGDLTTAPGNDGTGKISIKGEAELLGDLDIKGNVTAVTIEATESITAPNLKYN